LRYFVHTEYQNNNYQNNYEFRGSKPEHMYPPINGWCKRTTKG
jgi:hypothetical protein